jgi:signal peptidase I
MGLLRRDYNVRLNTLSENDGVTIALMASPIRHYQTTLRSLMNNSAAKLEQPEKTSHPWITYAIEGTILVLAVLLAIAIRLGVYETAIVISGSMEPTLKVNDRVLIDHRKSLKGKWRRGDIILFNASDKWGDDGPLTKRIIALPGEKISVAPGAVTVNGKALSEPYISPTRYRESEFELTMGAEEYFVMGDNRANSEDSRDLGPIRGKDIIGRAVWRLAPIGQMGKLSVPKYE